MKANVELGDVEQMLWRWTGWKAEQRAVDAVLETVKQYGRSQAGQVNGDPLAGAQSAADLLLADARDQARKILMSARDEATVIKLTKSNRERPSDDLKEAPWVSASLTPYQSPDGTVWLRVGHVLGTGAGISEERRRCTKCGGTKPITRFSRDAKSRNGYKAQCKDCENVSRRARHAVKQQEKGTVTTGVLE
jgi:hypothetical protein